MNNGITRDRALELVHKYIKNAGTIKHSLASEAVMKALANYIGENEQAWGLAGLLHDIDIEITEGELNRHGIE